MRNEARDVAVVVDGVVLHQFIKGFVPLVLMAIFPRELDKIDVSQYSVRYKYLLWARPTKVRR